MAATKVKKENYSNDLLACRICLASDVKLFNIREWGLDQAFMDLMSTELSACDGLPQHLCLFCRALLLRGCELRGRCQRAEQLLMDALCDQPSISTSYIRSIDRKLHKLAHTFSQDYSTDVKVFKYEDTQIGTKIDIYLENNIESDVKDFDDTTVTYDDDDDNEGSDIHSDVKPTIYIELEDVAAPQNTPKVNIVESIDQTVKQDVNTPQVNVTECIDNTVKKDIKSCKRKFPEVNLTECNDKTMKKGISCKRKFPEINVTEHSNETKKEDIKCCKRRLVKNKTEKKLPKEKKAQHWRLKPFTKEEGFKEFEEKYKFKIISISDEDMVKEMEARKVSDNYKYSAFKCESCFKGFLSQTTYDNHMKVHDPARAHECRLCHKRYFRPAGLREHMRDNHELKFQCLRCDETINTKYWAVMHAEFHAGRTFSCEHCGQQFTKSTTCNTHIRISHPHAMVAGGACELCGETFISAAGLKMHKARSHESMLPTLRCRKCKLRFESYAAIERHRNSQPLGRCDNKHSSCLQCGEAYESEQDLLTHRMQQHGLQLFTCDMCQKTFESKESVATHIDRVHLLIKPVPERPGFKQRRARGRPCARGRRETSAPPRPQRKPVEAVCEVCGKRATCMAALKIHMIKHTGERPFKCTQCPKTYSTPQGLKCHEGVHAFHAGGHKWRCDECDATFMYQSSLGVHRKTTHEPVHSGARKWSCEECDATFMRQSSLSLHRRAVHSGERAYQCHICSKTFTQSGSLYTHVKYVHLKVKPPPRKRNKKTTA